MKIRPSCIPAVLAFPCILFQYSTSHASEHFQLVPNPGMPATSAVGDFLIQSAADARNTIEVAELSDHETILSNVSALSAPGTLGQRVDSSYHDGGGSEKNMSPYNGPEVGNVNMEPTRPPQPEGPHDGGGGRMNELKAAEPKDGPFGPHDGGGGGGGGGK